MNSYFKVLASSVVFDTTVAAFRTNPAASTAVFQTQGATAGPLLTNFATGICLQANVGGVGATSAVGGTFNLLGSNVLEAPMFRTIATTTVSSSGPWILRDSAPWYKYYDFQFVPAIAGSSGFVTVSTNVKGNG